MRTRREILLGVGALATSNNLAAMVEAGLPAGAVATAEMLRLPGKLPLIKRSYRPPNLETPREYFRDVLTPNRAFFVRYHHANIPAVDARKWALQITGPAANAPAGFTLAQLRHEFEQVEITALCLCSGNRRGLFQPHVMGVQWGSGAMGNARWRGVRLRDVLQRAGVRADALEVAFEGADGPVLPGTPDFQKSLPIDKALDPETLIAFDMNGESLPHWHGAPARLVVPGWTATYWLKHLTSIELRNSAFDNFWVKTGYRVPLGRFPGQSRFATQESVSNTPITDIIVNSLITTAAPRGAIAAARPLDVRGMAWDSGAGIRAVETSTDRGVSWQAAVLGKDSGRFSLRPWSAHMDLSQLKGAVTILARATSNNGTTQPLQAIANPSGYHHNAIQTLEVVVA